MPEEEADPVTTSKARSAALVTGFIRVMILEDYGLELAVHQKL